MSGYPGDGVNIHVDDFNDDGVLTTELFLTKVGGVTFESRLLKDWKVLDGSQVDLHLRD